MNPDLSRELIAGSMSGVLVSWLVQWVKQSPYFPAISQQSDKINKILTLALGVLMSAGINVTHTWDATAHTFVLTIAGLTIANIGHFVATVYSNYIGAKVYYHTVTKPQVAAREGSTVGVIPAVPDPKDSSTPTATKPAIGSKP